MMAKTESFRQSLRWPSDDIAKEPTRRGNASSESASCSAALQARGADGVLALARVARIFLCRVVEGHQALPLGVLVAANDPIARGTLHRPWLSPGKSFTHFFPAIWVGAGFIENFTQFGSVFGFQMTRGSCEKFRPFNSVLADELVSPTQAPKPQPRQPVTLAAAAAPPPPPIAVTLAATVTLAAYRRAACVPPPVRPSINGQSCNFRVSFQRFRSS